MSDFYFKRTRKLIAPIILCLASVSMPKELAKPTGASPWRGRKISENSAQYKLIDDGGSLAITSLHSCADTLRFLGSPLGAVLLQAWIDDTLMLALSGCCKKSEDWYLKDWYLIDIRAKRTFHYVHPELRDNELQQFLNAKAKAMGQRHIFPALEESCKKEEVDFQYLSWRDVWEISGDVYEADSILRTAPDRTEPRGGR